MWRTAGSKSGYTRWAAASEWAGLSLVLGLMVAGMGLAVMTGDGEGGPSPEPDAATAAESPFEGERRHYLYLVPGKLAADFAKFVLGTNPPAGRWDVVELLAGADPALATAFFPEAPPHRHGSWPIFVW